MFAGHFASALVIKSREPRAPTWGLCVGVGVCDLVFGVLVALGVERVSPTPGVGIGISLDYVDWSHSLATTLLWSALFGAAFLRRGRAVALAMAVAVFSHWVLDWPMHPGDLAAWPNSRLHFGLGLWHTPYWWWAELAFIGACLAYYVVRARELRTFGGRWPWVCVVVLVVHVANSPWLAVGQ